METFKVLFQKHALKFQNFKKHPQTQTHRKVQNYPYY